MKFRMTAEGEKKEPGVRTALVLSGGGAKGAYQAGVIAEMLGRGMEIDLVTGSSIGAFNGVLLAEFLNQKLAYPEIVTRIKNVWGEVEDFISFNWSGLARNLFNPLQSPSLFTSREVRRILDKYIGRGRCFSDYTRCQLSVTGTSLNSGELRIFDFNSPAPVKKAVLASMAYPVAYPAVKVGDGYYIDGGFLDNAPLKEAILWGARRIYVVFLTPLSVIEGEEERGEEGYSILKVIDSLIDLAGLKLMYGDLKTAQRINDLIRILNKYRDKLPADFREEIRDLYGLKPEGEKRIVYINKIAPEKPLNPPGVMGFDREEILKEIMDLGRRDAGRKL